MLAQIATAHAGDNASEEAHMHFRPFAIEPAERVPAWGGHLMLGYENARIGDERRHGTPAEITLGLPGGFAIALAAEPVGHTHGLSGVDQDGARQALLKYAHEIEPDWTLAVLAEINRPRGESRGENTLGVIVGYEAGFADINAGAFLTRQRDNSENIPEIGANVYVPIGLGFGIGVEARTAFNDGQRENNYLLGINRVFPGNWAIDFAAVRTTATGQPSATTVTAGLGIGY